MSVHCGGMSGQNPKIKKWDRYACFSVGGLGALDMEQSVSSEQFWSDRRHFSRFETLRRSLDNEACLVHKNSNFPHQL